MAGAEPKGQGRQSSMRPARDHEGRFAPDLGPALGWTPLARLAPGHGVRSEHQTRDSCEIRGWPTGPPASYLALPERSITNRGSTMCGQFGNAPRCGDPGWKWPDLLY